MAPSEGNGKGEPPCPKVGMVSGHFMKENGGDRLPAKDEEMNDEIRILIVEDRRN